MSFAHEVRSELCALECPAAGRSALLYGLLLFGRSFGPGGIALQTEHPAIAPLCASLLEEECGVHAAVHSDGRRAHILTVPAGDTAGKIFSYFGYGPRTVSLRINLGFFDSDLCTPYFLRGAFLSCGSVVDPGKDYHLEFVTPHMQLGRDLTALLRDQDFQPKTAARKGNRVVYFKDSGQIEDVLTYIGAARQSLELMNVKVYKDLRNKANRVTNCETANIEKMVNASAEQVEAIRRLEESGRLRQLPDDLREIASLRLENPDASLRELGGMLREPLSRSGVNHRLSRLLDLARQSGG